MGDGHAATARPPARLPDGYHPSRAGAYLTACVFYGLLARRDPAESRYTGGLDPAQARWLQGIARESLGRLYGLASSG